MSTAPLAIRPKESSRSSRRRLGSTGPPVILGGGVGAIGKATELGVQNLDPYTTLYNRPSQVTSPTSPLFSNRAPSPSFAQSSTSTSTSTSTAMPDTGTRSRSPIPTRTPSAVPAVVAVPIYPVPSHAKRSQREGQSQGQAGSSASLSTTASTSSRTLKTPHAKEHYTPIIASGSGPIESSSSPVTQNHPYRSKQSAPISPTPVRSPVPSMAQGPLPPTPADQSESRKVSSKYQATSSRSKPAPLDFSKKQENRLSQDWVQIAPPSDLRAKSTSPLLPDDKPVAPRAAAPIRLPMAQMVAMKSDTLSPERPRFERMSSAPLTSPVQRENKQGRASLEHFRSVSPSPAPRQGSHSTPPAAILDAMRAASNKSLERPDLRTRRSEDLLRPSMDSAPSKKEIRAMQQRALGVTSTITTPPLLPLESERKSSGISIKKSSGALKALFTRGASGKGKEKADTTPPVPPRPSGDDLRRPSMGTRPTPTPVQLDESPQTRSSFSVERRLYPAAPTLQRAASAGAAPLLDVTPASRPRIPSRDLPSLPPPTPSPASISSEISPATPLAEALSASSLPYLSALANQASVGPATPDQEVKVADMPSETISSTSSGSTTRAENSSNGDYSPIKPSKSLHLLSLPELDLDFNFSFDKFSGSPGTPRRSPRRSPGTPSPQPSPVRSYSTRSPRVQPTPPALHRTTSERRRSQSFDGPAGSASMASEEFWKSTSDMGLGGGAFISPSVAKFFASAASSPSSVPFISPTLSSPEIGISETQAAAVSTAQSTSSHRHSHGQSNSISSQTSSSDHARTPSNASSTNETASPSPPRTPEDKPLTGLGFGDLSPSTTTSTTTTSSTPTPTASHQDITAITKKPFVLNEVPNIPLPALPSSSSLAPPAIIEIAEKGVEQQEKENKQSRQPRQRKRVLQSKSRVIVPDQGMSIKAFAREIERLLYAFRYPSQNVTSSDRASLLRNDLLNLMVEVDKRAYTPQEENAYISLRETCFHWAETLLFELRVEQPANERGACLEGLAAVVECTALSEIALKLSPAHQAKFKSMMIKCMTFVMGKLGAKGVFHNTLLFSGRFLAFAFFRIPHIGEQLVTVLQPPKGALMRFTRSVMLSSEESSVKADYPSHILPLCFDNSRSYTARLATLSAEFGSEEERDAFLFQPGNWLRRWQSDDSELFPAFYRAYHRQLAQYLAPIVQHYEAIDQPVPASVLMRAPGYAHLATIFAKKCHSYILGSVNAVTTSSSTQNFEATETAGFRGSQKPAVLETANRRLVETISTFANLKVMIPTRRHEEKGGVIECDGTQLWSDMIDIWTKNIIQKTSLYAPKGVFSLFDLLDGIVDPPFETLSSAPQTTMAESLLDIPYLIHVIRLILKEGEHALTLVKAIAFVFTHWEALTARPDDRKELCLDLLLEKELFERLLLFWSQSVRSYVLRLVVFRLGHLHTSKDDGEAHEVEIESVKLLQKRLDSIKKRHDQLEPKPSSITEIDDEKDDMNVPLTPIDGVTGMPRSRSTITMISVNDSPQTHTGSANKAERLLGLGFGMTETGPGSSDAGAVAGLEGGKDKKLGGKATNWFKKSFGKKKKDSNSNSPSLSPNPGFDDASSTPSPPLTTNRSKSPIPGMSVGQSPNLNLNRQGQNSKNLDVFTTGGGIKTNINNGLSSPSLSLDSPISTTSEGSSGDSTQGQGPGQGRKGKPPVILTTSPPIDEEQNQNQPLSPNSFRFGFELPTMSPRSDTFDPTPSTSSTPASPGTKSKRNSQPPASPKQPPSPHMSRSFSKRSSLLPSSTASALEMIEESKRFSTPSLTPAAIAVKKEEVDIGYDKKLHPYAIRMLAELEDAQKEYDEWWAEGGVGKMDGAPPRLTVTWPFHEGEE